MPFRVVDIHIHARIIAQGIAEDNPHVALMYRPFLGPFPAETTIESSSSLIQYRINFHFSWVIFYNSLSYDCE